MDISREQLQFLASQPIGSRELQSEADRIAHAQGAVRPSAELKETCKRIAQKWLPQGKRPGRRAKCNEPEAVQTDIEDAVEQAGGRRGGTA